MKNNFSIFTRSTLGLDNQVWLTLLIACLTSIVIFSFKAATYVKCTDFEIFTTGARQQTNNIFYIGETVNFSTTLPSQNQLEWNFGDGTPPERQLKKLVSHSFLKEGRFSVASTINGKCVEVINIYIVPTPIEDKKPVIPTGIQIIGVDSLYVGAVGHFTTPIKANYSYQWSVGASPDIPIQTTAAADFTFNKAGRQTVQLSIDGKMSFSKSVIVLRKPTPDGGNGSIPPVRPLILPPVITFIDPLSGGPGTQVTIHGSLFNGIKSVSFGGIPAKIISVSSDQIIAEVSRDGATGAIVITTESTQSAFSNPEFTFIPPKLDTITKKQSPEPVVPTGITDKQLKLMLTDVINNKTHAQDFDRFFCSGVNTKVYVNKEKVHITFDKLCESHLQGKKVEIESALITRDPDRPECVTNLAVKYKKKWDWKPFN
jgi:hypothetical protein